jgi:hypothetical protein
MTIHSPGCCEFRCSFAHAFRELLYDCADAFLDLGEPIRDLSKVSVSDALSRSIDQDP